MTHKYEDILPNVWHVCSSCGTKWLAPQAVNQCPKCQDARTPMTNPNQWEELKREYRQAVIELRSQEWWLNEWWPKMETLFSKLQSRTRQEVVGEIVENIEKELGAGGYPAVMFYLSRLKEQETK